MQSPVIEQRYLKSFDGTSICYQVSGSGPTIILANGLGGTYLTWKYQYALLGQRYRLICWDYRGLFRSGRPARKDTLSIEHQVKDLEAILVAEGVDKALFMGWSMGVQFNFEYYRHHADQFIGMVALSGLAGRPYQKTFGDNLLTNRILPAAFSGIKHLGPLFSRTLRAGGLEWTVPYIKQFGLAAPTLDMDVFTQLVEEFSTLDFEMYAETLNQLGHHDASDLLHRINVPVLIVAGSRDHFSPPAAMASLAASIPLARLVEISGGTHYAAVEYPREVNEHLRKFVRELAYGDLP